MTADDFPFIPGDKIRRVYQDAAGIFVTVTAVGRDHFLATVDDDLETSWCKHNANVEWERYVEPVVYPELWIAVLSTRQVLPLTHPHSADGDPNLLGVIYLRSDGTTEMLAP